MDDNIAEFVGSIPDFYDRGMGPVMFANFAADMAQRVKALEPRLVVETAAGTGILTRALRDALPGRTKIISTDLNPPMLEVARQKSPAASRWCCSRPMRWTCRSTTRAATCWCASSA